MTDTLPSPHPGPRWWPLAAIVALCAVALLYIWNSEVPAEADRVVRTMLALMLTTLSLIVWLLAFSRLRWRLRLLSLAAAILLAGLCASVFRIGGVSGDLVPIVVWRWSTGDVQAYDATVEGARPLPRRDYAQFLGPQRNAILSGVGLEADWNANPPREVWRRAVGEGWSSFAVEGVRAVTQEQHGPMEQVVCYDVRTGARQWTHGDSARYETALGGIGPRATPTIADDGVVFALGATGLLNALDLATGERLWTRDLMADGGRASMWGISGSPLILGDLVVVSAGGGEGRSLVAYRRDTGAPVWSGGDDPAGYSSPSVARLLGREQILIFNTGAVAAHDATDGHLLWRFPWPSSGGLQCVAQPVPLADDLVLVSTGYGIGSKLLRLSLDEGTGDIVPELVWESMGLKVKFSNMVLRDDFVYGLDEGILVCLDPQTGERQWKRGRYGHGQILLVGDLLLVQAESGTIYLVDANPHEFNQRAELAALSSRTWNNPALAAPYLLLRNDREAVCYELAVKTLAAREPSPDALVLHQ